MRVFLVDDSPIVIEKLAVMISGINGVEIAGQALNARDAIQSILKLKPDLGMKGEKATPLDTPKRAE